MRDFKGIILAAGEGTRMKSSVPKVLHAICGKRMIDYTIDSLRQLRLKKISVVVNKQHEQLQGYLKQYKDVKLSFQKKPQGTADAVSSAHKFLSGSKGQALIICADTPLVRKETLQALVDRHKESNASCTILTAFFENPSSFGRIIRDEYSKVCRIIEENDANLSQKQVKEVNSGIYCFKVQDLSQALNSVKLNAKKREYYLTDVVEVLYKENKRIETCICANANEVLGINSRMDLAKANDIMRMRIIEDFMQQGVNIIDPKTTFINHDVSIGKETAIYPFTVIESDVRIGDGCCVGPFSHLREGTVLKDNVVAGNFTEMVRSTIGEGTYCKHLSYLGDTTTGKGVNIGAGTVVANFDGKNKNKT
ncbi:MAG: sugar phosphate nucleotidyltransferase, partial [Candidatus Omnitrophica bacterium]|nr:sugar phosphate nucleotidyltransferase [Candidatus Omnitrophota bacterium]